MEFKIEAYNSAITVVVLSFFEIVGLSVLLVVLHVMILNQKEGYLVALENEAGCVFLSIEIELWQLTSVFFYGAALGMGVLVHLRAELNVAREAIALIAADRLHSEGMVRALAGVAGRHFRSTLGLPCSGHGLYIKI